jgi:hypothetical protein
MSNRVVRIQDHDGRGPFKPGFSHVWCDTEGDPQLPPWFQEFPGLLQKVRKAAETHHVGCGCRSVEQIERWFTPTERVRLSILGYKLVSMEVDRVLAESKNQVVFLREKPLKDDIEVLELR